MVRRVLLLARWVLLVLVLLVAAARRRPAPPPACPPARWGPRSLASLLPGTLAAGLGHRTAASDVPRFRWARFGLPLRVFNGGGPARSGGAMVLAPLVPMAEAARVFRGEGYLAATGNRMVGRPVGRHCRRVPPPLPLSLTLHMLSAVFCSSP